LLLSQQHLVLESERISHTVVLQHVVLQSLVECVEVLQSRAD
jgi:hypothetical protein